MNSYRIFRQTINYVLTPLYKCLRIVNNITNNITGSNLEERIKNTSLISHSSPYVPRSRQTIIKLNPKE